MENQNQDIYAAAAQNTDSMSAPMPVADDPAMQEAKRKVKNLAIAFGATRVLFVVLYFVFCFLMNSFVASEAMQNVFSMVIMIGFLFALVSGVRAAGILLIVGSVVSLVQFIPLFQYMSSMPFGYAALLLMMLLLIIVGGLILIYMQLLPDCRAYFNAVAAQMKQVRDARKGLR